MILMLFFLYNLILPQRNLIKGIGCGILSLILVSFQPILTIARPKVIDAILFAAMTVFMEAIIFCPLLLLEKRKEKLNNKKIIPVESNLKSESIFKKYIPFYIYLGINFAIAQVFFVLAYQTAGAINTSLAQTSTVLFSLIFAYFMHKEKISKLQVLFSAFLIFGIFLGITQGKFLIFNINQGIFLIIITAFLWMSAHAFTKPLLDKDAITPIQIVFMRNILGAVVLFILYNFLFPISNFMIIFDPVNLFYFVMMGAFYAFDIFFWYKALSYIEISKASIITSPFPILTSFLAFLILGERFTLYHLVAASIVILSIIVIVGQKPKPLELKSF